MWISEKKKSNKALYWALIAMFSVMFLISSTIVVSYFVKSQQSQKGHDILQSMHGNGTRPTRPTKPLSSVPTYTGPSSTDPIVPPATGNGEDDTTDPTVTPTQPINPTEPSPTEPSPTEPNPTNPPEPTVPTQPPHVEQTILESMQALYELNQDMVGWIEIPGTPHNVSYPVMQKKDYPDYYLYRDFLGEPDNHGCIYAEEHCDVFNPSDVVVLHGHHMGDGTMFHDLKNFKYKNYFKSHKTVYFDTLYEYREYEIVMVFHCSGRPSNWYPFFPYHTYSDFANEEEFNSFVESIRGLAIQGKTAELNYGDKLLLLSTCDYDTYPDGRLVVVAKLIEEKTT